jgi:hypothetical protein
MFDDAFARDTLTLILAIAGAVFGTIGTALGILNYLLQRRSHKLNLNIEITPYRELSNGKNEVLALDVRIVNRSYFDVTISEIGICLPRRAFSRSERAPLFTGHDHGPDKKLPRRIVARDEYKLRFPVKRTWFFKYGETDVEKLRKASHVYVETSDGKRFYGRKPGFDFFLKHLVEIDLTALRGWNQ